MPTKKCKENCIFSELVDLCYIATYNTCAKKKKIKPEKNIKRYFSWSSWMSSFFKQKTLIFCKEQVLVKNH